MNPTAIPGRHLMTRRLMSARLTADVPAPQLVARSRGQALQFAMDRQWGRRSSAGQHLAERGQMQTIHDEARLMGGMHGALHTIREQALLRGAGQVVQGYTGPDQGNYGIKATDTAVSTGATLPAANSAVYGSSAVTIVPASGANLRAQPNTGAQVLAGETTGTVLTVVGPQSGGWMNVQDPNGLTGWVYSAYVADASPSTDTLATPSSTPIASTTPSLLGGGDVAGAAASSGLLGLAIVGGAVIAAYYLLVK